MVLPAVLIVGAYKKRNRTGKRTAGCLNTVDVKQLSQSSPVDELPSWAQGEMSGLLILVASILSHKNSLKLSPFDYHLLIRTGVGQEVKTLLLGCQPATSSLIPRIGSRWVGLEILQLKYPFAITGLGRLGRGWGIVRPLI